MTPPARLQAAIDVLVAWFDGSPIEKALTNWARRARYAGSKDRAAVRDIVFDCLRKRLYFQSKYMVPDTPRALAMAHAKESDGSLSELFRGAGYGPAPLSEAEEKFLRPHQDELLEEQIYECPAWMVETYKQSLGAQASGVVAIMRERAEVFLRVNSAKTSIDQAQKALKNEGIQTTSHPLAKTALRVVTNPRRIAASAIFNRGLVELQDVASQAVILDTLEACDKPKKILDFCAGGGGKSLALAAECQSQLFATDISPVRMRDIPKRAERAGANVKVIEHDQAGKFGPYDLVFCDAPCSGSGAWRRNPEGKWRLTEERLAEIRDAQRDVLTAAAQLITPDGLLAYATCSVFRSENAEQISWFLQEHRNWVCTFERSYSPLDGGDGFYIAHLKRN